MSSCHIGSFFFVLALLHGAQILKGNSAKYIRDPYLGIRGELNVLRCTLEIAYAHHFLIATNSSHPEHLAKTHAVYCMFLKRKKILIEKMINCDSKVTLWHTNKFFIFDINSFLN